MRRIGIIGAGQTGRGLLPRLLMDEAQFVFTDRDDALIGRLREAGRYRIGFFGGGRAPVQIRDFRALPMGEDETAAAFRGCDAVFISVRAENTADAGAWLLRAAGPDVPLVVCENAPDPAGLVAPLGLRAASGAIFCTTTSADGLDMLSEDFPTLYVSERNLPDALKGVGGLTPVADFGLLMRRKLYTYNAASGIIAFLGAQKGYALYADAANDPDIAAALEAFYAEINRAICLEYGIDLEEQRQFAELSRVKFQNRAITDTVARNAASPLRKLGASERILEPIRLIERHGGDASMLYRAAVAALRLSGARARADAEQTLQNAVGIAQDDPRMAAILSRFDAM